jgi:hypothetical protein
MSLVKAKAKIRGVRPLLFHCFTLDTISLEKKERSGVAGNDPEEWKRTFTATAEGQLYLDPSYAFGCLREGARHVKRGLQSQVAATLQVLDNRILLNRFVPKNLDEITTDSDNDVYLDVRSVRNPKTKGRNVRYRLALAPGWETEFTLMWETTVVDRRMMEQLVITAGQLVGLADGRAVGFGRFEVLSFEVTDNAKKATA